MEYVIAVVLGVIFTEALGYAVHRLLHSKKIAWLTELHSIHHQHIYPSGKLRSESYISPPQGKILGIGAEWALPISVITVPVVAAVFALGAPIGAIATFVVIALAWTVLMVSYMHDAFHIKRIWLIRSTWFKRTRRLHDIHHLDTNNNFGICFFGLDKLFGTFRGKWRDA